LLDFSHFWDSGVAAGAGVSAVRWQVKDATVAMQRVASLFGAFLTDPTALGKKVSDNFVQATGTLDFV
jgi:4-hydroxyphenylpyruvate dioxygenase-like putative hemolysin